jgi:hypothetical protein
LKTFLNCLLILAVAVGAILFIGYVESPEATIRIQVHDVWPTLYDFEHWAEWYPEVESIVVVGDRNFHPAWMLTTKEGNTTFEVTEVEPYKKLQTRIESGSSPRIWTWALRDVPAGTEITITQLTTTKNIFLRGLAVFHDEKEPIEQALVALGNRLELRVVPTEVKAGEAKK